MKTEMITGSQYISRKIRKQGICLTIIGILLIISGTLIGIVTISTSVKGMREEERSIWNWIFSLSFLLAMFGYIIYRGVKNLIKGIPAWKHPEKSWATKRNPELFQMADQLYSNIIYEDSFIRLSSQVIANKTHPEQMTWIRDVYWIYEHIHRIRYYGIFSMKKTDEWILHGRFPENDIIINVNDMRRKKVAQCENILKQIFPNAVYGYTDKGREYLNCMRQRNGYY